MKSLRIGLLLGTIVAVAACVPKREAPPAPQPSLPRPQAVPTPPPPPPPPADWRDVPLTPGGWIYRQDTSGSVAAFGAGASPAFTVRCDRLRRNILLARSGITTGNMMTVRTSFGARNLPLSVQTAPTVHVITTLSASDPLLDTMAFSRGRFTIEVSGAPMLVIPAWPEPARVVEDCRG